MPLSDEKKEELKQEMPQVAIAGSSIRTKPGTDPDEAFDDVDTEADSQDESDRSMIARLLRWVRK